MKYAEVAVNSLIARRHTFCYSIPPQLTVTVGQAVWVPFGSKVLQGVVMTLSEVPSIETTKEIIGLISVRPLLSSVQIELALWLSDYYLASIFDAVALMLPPGFERRLITYLQILPGFSAISELSLEQEQVFNFIQSKEKTTLKEVERKFGKKKAGQIIGQLVKCNSLARVEQLGAIKVKPQLVPYVKATVSVDQIENVLIELRQKRASSQAAVIEFLAKQSQPISLRELRKSVPFQKTVIKTLEKRGLVSIIEIRVRRDPLAHLQINTSPPPQLTLFQEAAWQNIRSNLTTETKNEQPHIVVLAGVTGSGKTELYLRALAEVIHQGKKGICLVPEIALTSQTIERFTSRFPGRVAVFHSGLSLGEQFDEWHRIQNGDCDVVIGPRSALFVPQPNLGLIVVDEEHEWTYKQIDKSPRYHARDVAKKLAGLSGASIIVGSATPDVDTYFKAKQGLYKLVELKERITPRGISPLPNVDIVDMREELKAGNRTFFSRSLFQEMEKVLAHHEQVILFLNRRGTANFVQCQVCNYVVKCPRCFVALVYHADIGKLSCHHCNYSKLPPSICPQCASSRLKYFGIGTQKVEDETRKLFPNSRILRMDSDVTQKRHAHEEILAKFRAHKADILIGTQMVAKGLDIPQVTLAGVISADIGLNLPDFRAGERTFQLVCQIAGRAGRGLIAGKVFVQTYCPDHYAIKAALKHNYLAFYEHEIGYRQQFEYPPFSSLARLVFTHTDHTTCRFETEKMSRFLATEKNRKAVSDLRLIGPMPAYIARIRGRYQWQIILCGSDLSGFLREISFSRGWTVDVDPVSVI